MALHVPEGGRLISSSPSPRVEQLLEDILEQLRELARKADPPLLFTQLEAARRLGVSVSTLKSRIAAGDVRVVRLAGRGPLKVPSAELARLAAPPPDRRPPELQRTAKEEVERFWQLRGGRSA